MSAAIKVPDCPHGRTDCRFQGLDARWATGTYYPPIYDAQGRNTNPDRNVSSGTASCLACNALWRWSEVGGKRTYEAVE